MAVIAGLPKSTNYELLYSLKRATDRRNVVLGRMKELKYITQDEYQTARTNQLLHRYHGFQLSEIHYVTELVRQEMVKTLR